MMDLLPQVVLCGAGCSLRSLVRFGTGTVCLGGSLRTGGTWDDYGVMGFAKGGTWDCTSMIINVYIYIYIQYIYICVCMNIYIYILYIIYIIYIYILYYIYIILYIYEWYVMVCNGKYM